MLGSFIAIGIVAYLIGKRDGENKRKKMDNDLLRKMVSDNQVVWFEDVRHNTCESIEIKN